MSVPIEARVHRNVDRYDAGTMLNHWAQRWAMMLNHSYIAIVEERWVVVVVGVISIHTRASSNHEHTSLITRCKTSHERVRVVYV